MTHEPREPSADESQLTVEETDETADAQRAVDEPDELTDEELAPAAESEGPGEGIEETSQEKVERVDENQDIAEEGMDEPVDANEAVVEAEEAEEEGQEQDAPEAALEQTDVAARSAEEEEEEAEEDQALAEAAAEQAPSVESVVEAILFASDEPLTDSRLAGIVETTTKQVRDSIEALNEKYVANRHAFRIEQIAGGRQMLTLSTYNHWLKKMLRVRSDTKLSPAALETLAIIAYKQPIIRADIEAIRGVAVGEVIRSLMYKGLVKITGRAEVLGRPMLYGTTRKFLAVFGLNSLKDLPKAEELKDPDR